MRTCGSGCLSTTALRRRLPPGFASGFSSYIGEDEQAHLVGVFGNDSDIGAITAAVHEKACFTLTFPDGAIKEITVGEHASCYRSSVGPAGPQASGATSDRHLRTTAREWQRGQNDSFSQGSRRSLGVAVNLSWPSRRARLGGAHLRNP